MLRTSMKLGVAVLTAGLAITACGPVQVGAAAIVGQQRITTQALSGQVANLNAGYQKYKGKIQLQYPAAQMAQQALGWLIRFQVSDRMADRLGVKVTNADVQSALSSIEKQVKQGNPTTTLPVAAVANGLPPDLITDLARDQAVQQAVLNVLDGGKMPTAQAALQSLETQFNTVQCRAAKSLAIKVNPQFGALDYRQLTVVAATSALSASAPTPTPSASASAKPQLTPAC